ncbi:unnamed protein product [Darwinula stevensoni]|uniref:Lipase domain-containing protein n=1 Tax=Darwinula stevensoni TaxID=69355 RepID=A0A7R9A4J6_9CRUS|nr:unnamed protein product [Darwinula stevensoni]CAG0893710.1 unnamed protein product [Darwinula stevensoni]
MRRRDDIPPGADHDLPRHLEREGPEGLLPSTTLKIGDEDGLRKSNFDRRKSSFTGSFSTAGICWYPFRLLGRWTWHDLLTERGGCSIAGDEGRAVGERRGERGRAELPDALQERAGVDAGETHAAGYAGHALELSMGTRQGHGGTWWDMVGHGGTRWGAGVTQKVTMWTSLKRNGKRENKVDIDLLGGQEKLKGGIPTRPDQPRIDPTAIPRGEAKIQTIAIPADEVRSPGTFSSSRMEKMQAGGGMTSLLVQIMTSLAQFSDKIYPPIATSSVRNLNDVIAGGRLPQGPKGLLPSAVNGEKEVCYHPFGCFDLAHPWTSEDVRPVAFFPQPPSEVRPVFCLYAPRNPGTCQTLEMGNEDGLRESNFDGRRDVKVLVHGFLQHGRDGDMLETTGSDMQRVHVLGFSLGAHVAGYAGSALQGTGYRLGRITGLDPAGPQFQGTEPIVRLDPGDAVFVDVIHTDANGECESDSFFLFVPCEVNDLSVAAYGMEQRMGHVDFYPNGGRDMSGCVSPGGGDIVDKLGCDHFRALRYLTESLNSGCPFLAFRCDSWEKFLRGECYSCGGGGCVRLGNSWEDWRGKAEMANTGSGGAFFLHTGPSPPFCRVTQEVTVWTSLKRNAKGENKVGIDLLGSRGSWRGEFSLGSLRENGTGLRGFLTTQDVGHIQSIRIRALPDLPINRISIRTIDYNLRSIIEFIEARRKTRFFLRRRDFCLSREWGPCPSTGAFFGFLRWLATMKRSAR